MSLDRTEMITPTDYGNAGPLALKMAKLAIETGAGLDLYVFLKIQTLNYTPRT